MNMVKLALALTVPAIGLFAGAMMLRGPSSSSLSGARKRARRRKGLRRRRIEQRLQQDRQAQREALPEYKRWVVEQERAERAKEVLHRHFGLGDVTVHGTKGKPGFSISIEAEEIECFHNRWPAAGFEGLERVTATFDTNGDLVDLECNEAGGSCEKWDGSALVALTDDMQCAGESRMGIKDRCHSDEWLHCMRD
jgi:hypothetical protein